MNSQEALGEGQEGRLLAIALRHIRRDGWKRLTVVRIAEDAGMTHANVYRYFASKAAIGDRVVTDWLREIEQRLNDISQSPDPADDKLERFVTLLARAYDEKATGDPEVFAIFTDAAENGEAVAARHRQRTRELLRRVLDEGIGTRLFSGDLRRLERLTLDGLHRFLDPHSVRRSVARAEARGPGGMEARRDRVTRLVVRGLLGNRV